MPALLPSLSSATLAALQAVAAKNGLDWRLVAALAMAETTGDPWRMRFEPTYAYLKSPAFYAAKLGISFKTEQALQRMSYGVLQIMGARARELGFNDHLAKLCDLATGAQWGCVSLSQMARKYADTKDLIAAHNAGSPRRSPDGTYVNQGYVDRVTSIVKALGGA